MIVIKDVTKLTEEDRAKLLAYRQDGLINVFEATIVRLTPRAVSLLSEPETPQEIEERKLAQIIRQLDALPD